MNIAILLRGAATVSWLAAIALIVLAVVRTTRGRSLQGAAWFVLGAVVLALVLTTVGAGLVFIQPEERGVVVSAVAPNGYRPTALTPGLHWIIPFAENVVRYPISRQTYTMSIAPLEGQVQGDDSVAARTSDGQEVLIDASVIYAVNPEETIRVHIDWQNRYDRDLVRPLSRGIIRDEAAQFRVDEIVSSKRFELINSIREKLEGRLEENGIVLVDFVLRNITFSPEYAASVEQKQIAEQQAQQAAFVVEQRKQEAEQARQVAQGQADANVIAAEGRAEARLIEAQAESEALKLIAEAIENNPDLITFEYIQKLAPGIQVMLVPSDNPFLLPLPEMGDLSGVMQATPQPTPEPSEAAP
jgi:regulator of protease activity HflC (stomatin/prohibitin superfamily)